MVENERWRPDSQAWAPAHYTDPPEPFLDYPDTPAPPPLQYYGCNQQPYPYGGHDYQQQYLPQLPPPPDIGMPQAAVSQVLLSRFCCL